MFIIQAGASDLLDKLPELSFVSAGVLQFGFHFDNFQKIAHLRLGFSLDDGLVQFFFQGFEDGQIIEGFIAAGDWFFQIQSLPHFKNEQVDVDRLGGPGVAGNPKAGIGFMPDQVGGLRRGRADKDAR